jgi:uncharacterized membrane protein YwaF
MGDFILNVLGRWRIYLLMGESIGLVIVTVESFRRYRKYRSDAYDGYQI